ncbi:MAG: phosphatase PAP2 family protein [Treponema sp.]|nr:phosphatase PAP2 family protein [Treponema sp.]
MNKMMRRFAISLLFLSILSLSSYAKEPVFKLDLVSDSICLASGAALEISSLCYPRPERNSYSKDDINSFDRNFMHSYDFNMDVFGWSVLFALAAEQLTLNFTAEKDAWKEVLVMSVETILINDGIKNYIKRTAGRERPYTYYESSPSRIDPNESFVSGHAMNGFAIASFSTYVYSQLYPESNAKWLVGLSSFTLAGITSLSRIPAGCHFPSDIACGAVFGSTVGFLVPYLHRRAALKSESSRKEPVISLLPDRITVCIRL